MTAIRGSNIDTIRRLLDGRSVVADFDRGIPCNSEL
jgi:hypothetical protein